MLKLCKCLGFPSAQTLLKAIMMQVPQMLQISQTSVDGAYIRLRKASCAVEGFETFSKTVSASAAS